MTRLELIRYLNRVKPYMNLSALCHHYNRLHSDFSIDYNNLRVTLNNKAPYRLSTEKLQAFVDFLQTDIFEKQFKLKFNSLDQHSVLKSVIEKNADTLLNSILEAINHGIQD